MNCQLQIRQTTSTPMPTVFMENGEPDTRKGLTLETWLSPSRRERRER